MAQHKKVLLKKAGSILIGIEKRTNGKKKVAATLPSLVPVLSILIDCLEKQGREIEGLFRVNGSLSELNALRDDLVSRPPSDLILEEDWDPHVVAGLVKMLLRELEDPLLLFSLYDHLLGSLDVKEDKAQLQVMKAVIDSLPKENRLILSKLLRLFYLVSRNESLTKMSAHNLAVVMGPTIMRPSGESFDTMMSDSSKVVSVVTILIDNVDHFCKGSGESITITSPVNLNEQEMGKLLPINNRDEKRDLRKKYDELKKSHQELLQNYDELRTQYSVLEAYSAKMDLKVSELEDLLESMEHIPVSRIECDSNLPPIEDEDELAKLRAENEWLREVLIRATREDVVNLREDSTFPRSIKTPRESTIPAATNLPLKRTSSSLTVDMNSSEVTSTLTATDPQDRTTARKSLKISNAFIKKQSSTKIIQKIKSHKSLDPRKALEATGNLPPLTSPSSVANGDKRLTLNAINETKPESSTGEAKPQTTFAVPSNGPPRHHRSIKASDESKTLVLTSSCRNIVPPLFSPGKITRQNTMGAFKSKLADITTDSNSGNPLSAEARLSKEVSKENLKDSGSKDKENNKENSTEANKENFSISLKKEQQKSATILNKDSNNLSLTEVLQKMIELEQQISKESAENESRKQLEVRTTVAVLVGSLTHLSQKLCL